jgi:hypothetical protein
MASLGGKPPLIRRYRMWPLLIHNPRSGPDRVRRSERTVPAHRQELATVLELTAAAPLRIGWMGAKADIVVIVDHPPLARGAEPAAARRFLASS